MVCRDREVARVVRDHRQCPALRQPRQHDSIARILPQQTGDDDRRARVRDPAGELLDVRGRRHRCARTGTMRAIALRRCMDDLAEHLARQREIDRTFRRSRRQFQRAIDHGCDLVAALHLVVPLHHLAQHAGLVVHLLRPVDVRAARTFGAGLGERRASGGQQHRHAIAARIDQHVDRVRRANVGVQHHRLRLAGDHGVAMRHRHRGVLVRHHHRPRHLAVGAGRAREGLDDGREVGAGIAEQVVDAVRGQRVQIVFRRDARLRFAIHVRCSCSRYETA